MNKDYVSVVYNENDRPLTSYPYKLTQHLFERFKMKPGDKLLDLGCGRGEFLDGFVKCGMEGYGVDQSVVSKQYFSHLTIKQSDLENAPLPFEDNFFDVVYSKSVIEHFYYPEKLMKEVYRILKPGGLVISLTPDWEVVYKMFYEDFTHRTPFTKVSLFDFKTILGFQNVGSEKFIQLPLVWKYPFLKYACKVLALITPEALKKRSKTVRFSKELMLLGYGTKPQ